MHEAYTFLTKYLVNHCRCSQTLALKSSLVFLKLAITAIGSVSFVKSLTVCALKIKLHFFI